MTREETTMTDVRRLAQDALRECIVALERAQTSDDVTFVLGVTQNAITDLQSQASVGLAAHVTPTLSRAASRLAALRISQEVRAGR